MRGIVQYEVYVLHQGRWSLHARYAGAQRADALLDANSTEVETGRATKVVRDTYWPDVNQNEEITTYLSPKARALQALGSRRKGRKNDQAQTAPLVRTAAMHPLRQRSNQSRTLRTIRLIVALGMSLIFASALTALFSAVLHHAATIYEIEPGTITILLTICYLLVFTYVFPKAFRARLKLHRLLAEMWANTDKPASKHPPRRVAPRSFRGAPGRPWEPPHDRRTGKQEAQIAATAPVPLPIEPKPVPVVAAPPPPPPPPVLEKAPPVEAKAPPPPPAKGFEAPPPVETASLGFTPGTALEVPEGLSLERIILRRFAVDLVTPSISRTHRDDPVTRRGVALLLAGAIEGLTQSNPVNELGAMALLAEAMRESGARAAAIESFLGNYENNIAARNAQPVMAAGRAAIAGYVGGGRGIERDIQQALAVWRFPSSARLVPVEPEFYLFSIAREESLTDTAPSVGLVLHQAIVRAALEEFGGEEVPHDAAGILGRFSELPPAFEAARAVQTRIAAAAGPATASVIVEGPTSAPGVPEEIASILNRGRELLSVTVDGEVVCDASVHRALGDAAIGAEPVKEKPDVVRIVDAPVA